MGQDDILAHATLRGPQFGVPVWKEVTVTEEQKRFAAEGLDAACRMDHSDGTPGMRHVVALADVVKAFMLAIGSKAAIGKAFPIAAASPFTYDVLSEYISKKLDIPVLRFKVPEFHDFRHDISFSRSVLGWNPDYDILKIVDAAVEFRKDGKNRVETKYIG